MVPAKCDRKFQRGRVLHGSVVLSVNGADAGSRRYKVDRSQENTKWYTQRTGLVVAVSIEQKGNINLNPLGNHVSVADINNDVPSD